MVLKATHACRIGDFEVNSGNIEEYGWDVERD